MNRPSPSLTTLALPESVLSVGVVVPSSVAVASAAVLDRGEAVLASSVLVPVVAKVATATTITVVAAAIGVAASDGRTTTSPRGLVSHRSIFARIGQCWRR